jgi:3-deoxy-D-manno-octulosonic-acid transferase
MTATGREAARRLFGDSAQVAWLAYDYPSAVRRFLRHFRPRIGILMETEIWFHLVAECKRSRVPLMLANARMSAKSARGYAMVRPLVRDALAGLRAVAAQTAEDADRLRSLGAREIEVTGNLKFDAEPAAGSESLAAQFRLRYGNRRIFRGTHSDSTRSRRLCPQGESSSLGAAPMSLWMPIARYCSGTVWAKWPLTIVPAMSRSWEEACFLLAART